mmetsp:Transcript_31965/g.107624  ORF Transcript_31965/g.107624 Transcript_31965/m.107624 type:complete len:294 (+) Transcript_31965:263-1144(+)
MPDPSLRRVHSFEDQNAVVAAKPKVLRDGHAHATGQRFGDVWDIVEVAFGVWRDVVDGGRHGTSLDGLYREDGFNPARGAQSVPRRALGRRDAQLRRVCAEDRLQGGGLELVVVIRRSPVRVDVVDFRRFDARRRERHGQTLCETGAAGRRRRDVVRVARRAVPRELGVDSGPPSLRVVQRLDDDYARALAHDEASAAGVEWPRGVRGVVVVRGAHGFHRPKPPIHERRHGRLGPAADDHVRVAALHGAHRLADGVRARRARRDDAKVRPAAAELDGHHAGRRVAEHGRDRER